LGGYGGEYPDGILPIDTYDFIADHHLVCVPRDGVLHPLMGYRAIPLERCDRHQLPFPGLSLLRDAMSETRLHQRELEALVARCREKAIPLEYQASWTMSPELRDQREFRDFLRDALLAILLMSGDDRPGLERVLCGVPRFKTDALFLGFGFEALSHEGEVLPPVIQRSLRGEPVRMLHCVKVAEWTRALREKFGRMWNDRLCLPAETAEVAAFPPERRKAV
jgi:hypothetical protein